jgi:polyribonucleotide nucleotidyltransferase
MKKIEKSIDLGGRKLTLSTGQIAEQASSAVMATYGETVVLATVVASEPKQDFGYFPLFVEYQKRLYAGGRIKGSRWVKRDGRPSDDDILVARLIDRSIRPLFPKDYNKEVQVIVAVLSVDLESTPDMVAGIAVSAALASSSIPWNGPVAMMKAGLKDEKFIINPVRSDIELSEMELVASLTKDAIVMIEANSKEVPEAKMLEGIEFLQKEGKKVITLIDGFAKEVGRKKEVLVKKKKNITLEKKINKLAGDKIKDLIKNMATTKAGYSDFNEMKGAVMDSVDEEEKEESGKIFQELFSAEIKKMILAGKRPDGRKPEELRKLSAEVGILPRTHGSAIFNRGQTQALSVATLGSSSLEQLIESAEGEEVKRYIHHYSMPPFSVGETGRIGFPSRREVGHGALAEKALLPVIPSKEDFPYTIRIATDILSSNGSSSMASACGSTLSLMDAGVPIKAPVAGIAMGLVIENEKKHVILTDILGMEDGNGDMDFKVAGTKEGITALQLDVKTLKLTASILEKAMKQAKEAREKILEAMLKALSESRTKVSTHAPKIKVIKIDPAKIGEIIGPGGKMIRKIIAETGAQVDVEDDGSVSLSGAKEEEVAAAIEMIEGLTKEVAPGEIYDGEVKRIQQFGAFVEVLPGKDGLVHVSDMSKDFVKDPSDVVSVGDKVKVRVKEIDNLGRINLSMLLDGDKDKKTENKPSYRKPEKRFDRKRPPQRGGSTNRKSSGPHFPTSRYLEEKKKNF